MAFSSFYRNRAFTVDTTAVEGRTDETVDPSVHVVTEGPGIFGEHRDIRVYGVYRERASETK